MSQTGDITCPECNTPHLTNDPFCENCGYRIGRPETAFEGYQAIPKEMARRAAQKTKSADQSGDSHSGVRPRPGRPTTQPEQVPVSRSGPESGANAGAKAGGETQVEGHRAVKPEYARTIREHPPLEPGTLVEGLAPVERRKTEPEETSGPARGTNDEPATVQHAPVRPAEVEPEELERAAAPESRTAPKGEPVVVTPAQAAGDESDGSGRTLLAIGWLMSVAVAVGVTLFATQANQGDGDEASTALPVAPKRVKIPAGTFEAGLDEKVRSLILLSCQKMSPTPGDDCEQDDLLGGEFPVREVTAGKFEIDHAEVRVGQYRECVDAGSCDEPAWDDCKVYTHQGYQFALRVPKALKGDDVPMTCVTRDEANAYCKWADGRLPSNDEWERAARGDDGRLFPWGNNWAPELANWAEADIYRTPVVGELDGFASVAPPGQFPDGKSPYGVFDMAGNVAEWVDSKNGIARGGAWTSQPFDLRVTGRFELDPGTRRTDVGFRCLYE